MEWNKLFLQDNKPTMDQIRQFISNPLWEKLNGYLTETYGVSPGLEYSCCSAQPGWNIKYRKKSKNLCTIYPLEGLFIVLVVINGSNMVEADYMVKTCCDKIRGLFENTKLYNNCKWLMIDVTDEIVLNDTIRLIGLRAA